MAQVRGIFIPILANWVLITVHVHPSGQRLDLGKVLAGIQAPEEDSARFSEFLRDLGYPYVEETQNVVYKRYLRK